MLSHLPAAVHQGFVAGYAQSIQTVFLIAVPIAALAFLATWLIPQVELEQWPEAGPEAAAAALPQASAATVAAAELPAEEPRQATARQPVTQEALDPQEADSTDL